MRTALTCEAVAFLSPESLLWSPRQLRQSYCSSIKPLAAVALEWRWMEKKMEELPMRKVKEKILY
jgi:hypothetical protein